LRKRKPNKDYKLSWNMLVWLREDAKQEINPTSCRDIDDELLRNMYTHPHFITAGKALRRRELIGEDYKLTEAGWSVVEQHWPRLAKKRKKIMKSKKKIYRVDCYSKYGNRYECHFLLAVDDESLIKQVEERIKYGLYEYEHRRTCSLSIATGYGFSTPVAKFQRNKEEKWERQVHV
jgi:hypothetical protein